METNTLIQNTRLEPKILVNLNTRKITVPEELYKIGVTGDNCAETVYIQVPDSYDDVLLNDKKAYVWFQNAKGEPCDIELTDITHIDNFLIIGWSIDERLTRYAGKVQFQLQFSANNYILNSLSGEFEVMEGLDVYSTAPPLENNLYEHLLRRISNLEQEVRSINQSIEQISEINLKLTAQETFIAELKNEMIYLKENVVYIPT